MLSAGDQSARSISFALARGTRIDTAAREQLCTRAEARRAACPETSRIGFGRFAVTLQGFALGSAGTELGWAIDAYLGQPLRRGDAASVVLKNGLLGADLVGSLLTSGVGSSLPRATVTVGRLMRRASGRYGVELRFDELPVEFNVPAPVVATPKRLELSLGAVRRIRQNFTRRLRVRTLDGYEIRKIQDHRLVGHHLLRAPASCNGSWPTEVRVGFASGERRSAGRIACTKAAPSSASLSGS